jgi:hypothetical protein
LVTGAAIRGGPRLPLFDRRVADKHTVLAATWSSSSLQHGIPDALFYTFRGSANQGLLFRMRHAHARWNVATASK